MPSNDKPSVIPAEIYKFMPRRYLDDFMSGKSVRVGTLEEFRNAEDHAGTKLDPSEGVLNIGMGMNFGTLANPIDLSDSKYSSVLDYVNNNTSMRISGMKNVGPTNNAFSISGPNMHIFCVSYLFDSDIAGRLDKKYDVCVKIKNVLAFIAQLNTSLSLLINTDIGPSCGPVMYDGDDITIESKDISIDPFRKDSKFSLDKEFRIVFLSRALPGQPPRSLKNVKAEILQIDTSQCGMELCWER